MILSNRKFKVYRQFDQMDCGPTCLRMVSSYYGKHYSLEFLKKQSYINRDGVSLKGISLAAQKIGFNVSANKISYAQLKDEVPFPCILHWNQNHFIVIPPQNRKSKKIKIADPARGIYTLTKEVFLESWISDQNSELGVCLLLEPENEFYDFKGDEEKRTGFNFLINYLKPYQKYLWQLIFGLVLGSAFSLIIPFLTQGLVDFGVSRNDYSFINLILIAQLFLFVGNTIIEVIRAWIILHITTRINISIISDFLIKLMNLPIRFFDTKLVGDINQRILDHGKIEQFLSITTLNTIFSIINLLIFSIVLTVYDLKILLIFLIGSGLSIIWVLLFLKRRKELDYMRFQKMSQNQNALFEIITGLQEIKLTNSQDTQRWRWEKVQIDLFKLRLKNLALGQFQSIGSSIFIQLKNIFITFFVANEVINGNMTLGMMISVTYILGQMISPIEQLLSFFLLAQDAKLSVERMGEIHNEEDEETPDLLNSKDELDSILNIQFTNDTDNSNSISFQNVSFQYGAPDSPFVLQNVSLDIPFGKTTAIVGSSGSGKTTLIKLILKYYEPISGEIKLRNTSLSRISPKLWWDYCGIVLSDGYIFSNTIERNIAVQEPTDLKKLNDAIELGNIKSFIESLPMGFNTKIGNDGNGISSGQKQRILIARAMYKDPKFLILDEATSTLDAINEKMIVDKIKNFSLGRTVIVIAHRMSTVRYADQIVVLEKGNVVEVGNHTSLTRKKGKYFELVRNQLDLGD